MFACYMTHYMHINSHFIIKPEGRNAFHYNSCFAVFITGQNNKNYGFNWLVVWFGFNAPLRLYFSLYWAVSQREGEKEVK